MIPEPLLLVGSAQLLAPGNPSTGYYLLPLNPYQLLEKVQIPGSSMPNTVGAGDTGAKPNSITQTPALSDESTASSSD